MAAYDLDTSALIKRYTRERGSSWGTHLLARGTGHALYTVRLTGPEAIAAFACKGRTGELTSADAERSGRAFRRHWRRRLLIVEAAEGIAAQIPGALQTNRS